jgi:hypothetical protein
VIAGFGLWWRSDAPHRTPYLRGLVVVAIAALIVFAPLGLYFIQHPWTFTGRAEALWDPTHPFEKTLGTLAMFSLRGDMDESVNIKISPFSEVPPALAFAMRGDDSRVRVYDGRRCTVVRDAPHQPLTYIVILADKDTLPLLKDALPGGSTTRTQLFSTYRVTAFAPVTLQPQHVARAVFGHQIQLEGYDASLRSQDGQSLLDLVFYWRALKTVTEPYTVFIHLLSSQGQLQAQHDSPPCGGVFRTDRWSPDEITVDRYTLSLPSDLAAGPFRLNAGLYHSYELQRLDVVTELKTADNMIELPGAISLDAPR